MKNREIEREAEVQSAVDYFNDHRFEKYIYAFLDDHSPMSLSVVQQLAYSHPEEEVRRNWRGVVQRDHGIRTHRPDLNTVSGAVFEYLALAHLKTTEGRARSNEYVEMGSKFDETVDLLMEMSHGIKVSEHPGRFFSGYRLRLWRKPFVIPDIALLRPTRTPDRRILDGFLECNFTSKTKTEIDYSRKFARIIRLAGFFEQFSPVVFEGRDVVVRRNRKFNLYLVVRNDFSMQQEQKAKELGWEIIRTPFYAEDVTQQAILVLRAYLDNIPWGKRHEEGWEEGLEFAEF